MKLNLPLPAAALAVFPVLAHADPVKVITDIAPIESLVLQVAGSNAEVSALVAGGASPHGFQFSYDQAEAVQSADLVIWVGPALTPWLDEALDTLAPGTSSVALLETTDWPRLERRDRAIFVLEEDHDEHGDEQDEHDHDDHDHEEAHNEDDHDDHAGHDHGEVGDVDPHAWIDPQVAIAWVDDIAAALSEADPENAATYAANAEATIATLTALDADIAAKLAGLPQTTLVAPHDAYQYFGNRYGLPDSGSISVSDATTPGPDRVAALQELVRDNNITCVLSDPQSRSEWVELVREGTDANTAIADTLGAAFPQGADHYAATLHGLADAYYTCLGGTE